MQNSSNNSRTPSSILRKRAAEEQALRRQRHKGRRVSFAPDEDLVTTQLYALDKNSPLLDIGGALGAPLAELQNATLASRNPAMGAWPEKPHDAQQQQHQLQQQGHPVVENSPGFSPMSMELTNDTLQEAGALAFALTGTGSGDTDSLVLNSYQAAGGGGNGTQNITDNVPGLSTLLEEDEEDCYQESERAPSMGMGPQLQGMGDDEDDNDVEMELTGTARLAENAKFRTPPSRPSGASPYRRSSRLSAHKPSPTISNASPAPADNKTAPSPASVPRSSGRGRRSSISAASPGAAAAAASPAIGPSPLRRTTRSMGATPSPLAGGPAAAAVPAGAPSPRAAAVAPPPRTTRRASAAAAASPLAAPAAAVTSPGSAGRRQARRSRGSTMGLSDAQETLAQQSKWGFVPGDDDTLLLALDQKGGGLGDATLHHVYAESAATGDITLAVRNGTLPGDRDDEESPDQAAAEVPQVAQQQQEHAQQEAPAEGTAFDPPVAAALPDSPLADALLHEGGEGMTTKLLMDDKHTWSHVMLPQPSLNTGRGSVGSNALGLTGHLGGTTNLLLNNTTQLLHEHGGDHSRHAGARPFAAPRAAPHQQQPPRQPEPGFADEPTTKLLADATGASCSMRAFARAAPVQQDAPVQAGSGTFSSPDGEMDAPMQHEDAQAEHEQPEATLELQAMAMGGAGAVTGHSAHHLEDHTLDDFAPPPELATGATAGQGGTQHQATTPFAGAMARMPQASPPGYTDAAPHAEDHTISNTPPPQADQARAPIISFQDFLQLVDMQFLDHIRRGTSINLVDLAQGPEPQDLAQALSLLTLTSAEIAVVEGAIGQLQELMQNKRAGVRELEEALEGNNPPVFGLVQTASRAELEDVKHALALKKRGCRSETADSWKRLRQSMEQQLGERLQEQDMELQEHIDYINAQLQRVEQQSAFATEFGADVHAQNVAEEGRRREAAAAKANLRHMRQRLAELTSLNAERQARADEVAAQQQALQARKDNLERQRAATERQLDELKASMPAVATPVRSQAAADRLADKAQQLDILAGLQSWKLKSSGQDAWRLDFKGILSCDIDLQQSGTASEDQQPTQWAIVAVAVAPRVHGVSALVHTTLTELVSAMPCSLSVPACQLPMHLPALCARLSRAVNLSQQLGDALLSWRLLARTAVDAQRQKLLLTFLEPERELKATLEVALLGLMEPRLQAGLDVEAMVQLSGEEGALTASGLANAIAPIVAPGASGGSTKKVLHGLCAAVSGVMLGGSLDSDVQQGEGTSGALVVAVPAGSQTPMARMFSNPLFRDAV